MQPEIPAGEYSQRLKAREMRVAQFEKLHRSMGNVRLLLAVAAAIAAWWSIERHAFSPWWLMLPVAAFVGVAVYHDRVLLVRSHAERAVAIYRKGLARIEDRWMGSGEHGERFDTPNHIYAADLDLFGAGSLFELLTTARTRMGEDALAQWLLSPSTLEQIQERHVAIAELRPKLDFREELAVLGKDPRVGVHHEALLAWAEAPNCLPQSWLRWFALLLAVAAMTLGIVWAVTGVGFPFIVILLVEAILTYGRKKRFEAVLSATEGAFENLDLLSALLARLESEPFQSPRLQTIRKELSSHHLQASQAIARLRKLVQYIHSRQNMMVRFLDVALMYTVQVAYVSEAWRNAHGNAVRNWLRLTGEMEALISLSTYSYEHPSDPFPDFLQGAPSFQGEEIGHPLIPSAKCVRNDVSIGGVSIGGDPKVLLISGSNMSGKSTLMRAVGMNTVLAMAGAPVRARRLRLTLLHVGASIRVNDSLQEGNSRFYAEILRLRQIYDLAAQSPPLLFLLDELLQGTNSKDRRIGAEGIVQALMELGSIGMISTHDLALTDIGDAEKVRIHNMHLQDELKNGRMRFDFKLREGVVTKSNGLELMRSIGLKV